MKFVSILSASLLLGATIGAQERPVWTPAALAESAVRNSPAIAELDARITAAKERRLPATAQPNPMVMAGVQDLMVDFSEDEMMTMYMAGVEQTITRPSKLDARGKIVDLEAGALEKQRASLVAEAERASTFAYIDIAAIDAQLATVREVRELVAAIAEAARVRYEVGTAVQAEVLRAQLEQSNLEHQLLQLRGSRRAAVARLLSIVGLPQDTEVPVLAMIDLSAEQPAVTVSQEHPAIATLAVEIERRDAEAKLAALALRPDVNLEASYGYRPMQTDMFSVTAKVEIPWRKKQLVEPRIREALALKDAARQQIEQVRRTLLAGLAAAIAAQEETTEQLRFHREVLVPQSRMALDSTLASFQTGRSSFDSVLASETTYLRLQLDAIGYQTRKSRAAADFTAIQRGARSGAASGAPELSVSAPSGGSTGDSSSPMSTM